MPWFEVLLNGGWLEPEARAVCGEAGRECDPER